MSDTNHQYSIDSIFNICPSTNLRDEVSFKEVSKLLYKMHKKEIMIQIMKHMYIV